jgi:outer membrane protein TolC
MLTLEECLKLGIENNLSLEGSRNEMRKAKHLLSENRAKLWPQISAVASFNDNFNPPVSVTDGSAYGNLYNVTKTLQYNASAGLQLQMPLYNQTVYTAVDIARTLNELNRLSYEKAREDLMMQISKMYYLGQNTMEQLTLIQENMVRLRELRDITLAFFDNGMAMEVDVKRVNINLENQQVQYDNAKSMLVQQLNLLKYVMDYPAEEEITLTPVDTERMQSASLTGLRGDLYELQLLQSQEKLAGQQKDLIRQGYLPSLCLLKSGNIGGLEYFWRALPLMWWQSWRACFFSQRLCDHLRSLASSQVLHFSITLVFRQIMHSLLCFSRWRFGIQLAINGWQERCLA